MALDIFVMGDASSGAKEMTTFFGRSPGTDESGIFAVFILS